ncbi:methyltransferase [Shewanella cyperi]|uniref:methyltransferase n=1 Tax=Shewanella cyperi TaxID=2814292 RepID=UPI001A93EF03|nr:methyltransferase [Shewanella cyperi]QSX42673.1 methyltransferase [Shewanella cyperi]
MTTRFSAAGIEMQLRRYPETADANLQAWDAADEHLLQHLSEAGELPKGPVMLLNDSFGALCCSLKQRWPETELLFCSDARTGHLGAQANLTLNDLAPGNTGFHASRELASLPVPGLVLAKLPKNLNFLADQLRQLSGLLPAGTRVLIGAKAKSINKALLENIGSHLGPAQASLAWKKTRIITVVADGKPRPPLSISRWSVPEYDLTLSNLSNVFAASKLDIGARLMLEHMPTDNFRSVIDLGCGNGVLGLRAAQLYPEAQVHFVDESEMAVASAEANWKANGFKDKGHFHWDDCLSHLDESISADLILCNPPFHQGEAITDHIAWQMFNDAKRRLKPGGLLQVVGNRHLGYHIKLKRLFGNCKTVASNGKFVILQAWR